ncbi:RNA-guided endonuclease InsQ/TnpB family protein [Streptomyces massasporeus]|uniref:RNA-guided endonuclease InsQ/TnpB family protein n=1 Tax=Streptomyces massasporeus TaxID=67324 RepID=UPI001672D7AE|nr:RNA-guided endonuclease TnpB family protein [Streptomyces massasporeus]GGV91799.1 transposase [Streptomyces massasporeus]
MLTGRKYRLKLTPEQGAMCEEFGNICRAVWNTALEQRRTYRKRGAYIDYVPQSAQLTEAKREFEWLRAAPASILQQTLRDLERACRRHGAFKVHWRSKTRWSPSFRFPEPERIKVRRINRKWAEVKLPRIGWLTFRWTRPIGGEIRSATVSRKAGSWHISFLVEDGLLTPDSHDGRPVGVDLGVAVAVTTSAGTFHDRKFASPGERSRYRRLQQRLARQRRGSSNRLKTVAAMRRAMARVTDRRSDFYARTAKHLTEVYGVIALEDLAIKNMTASAHGTVEIPGKNVRQKAGLNRVILDKGWHRLVLAIHSAARYSGSQVLLVNPAYTSQTCNRCKHVDSKSRKSQAVFVCTTCGHQDHADVNAAKNILSAAGYAVPACGDLAVGRSVKQEPATPRGGPHQLALPLAGIPER